MAKKNSEAVKIDALSVAERCTKIANDVRESLPTIAAHLDEAAATMVAQYEALVGQQCQHTITTTVTDNMVARGLDERAAGKYCMTCGEKIERPKKTKAKDESAEA